MQKRPTTKRKYLYEPVQGFSLRNKPEGFYKYKVVQVWKVLMPGVHVRDLKPLAPPDDDLEPATKGDEVWCFEVPKYRIGNQCDVYLCIAMPSIYSDGFIYDRETPTGRPITDEEFAKLDPLLEKRQFA